MKVNRTSLSDEEFDVLQSVASHREGLTLVQLQRMHKTAHTNTALRQLIDNKLVQQESGRHVASSEGLTVLEPYRVRRAVILAAGKGGRMLPETIIMPKPMIYVGKKRIIETQLDALLAAGITDITIVRGYLGEMFDALLHDYPTIKFIDNPHWNMSEAIVSAQLAVDLLAGAYLLEGDLYIRNPHVIRAYEYRSSYCGVYSDVINDWHFHTSSDLQIRHLAHGDSNSKIGLPHRFVGIMHWTMEHTKSLKNDLETVINTPDNNQRFIESVPFDDRTSSYDIFARQIDHSDVVEVDTYQELLALRASESN